MRRRFAGLANSALRLVGTRAFAAVIIALCTASVLRAQDIEPDRPDVTNGTHIVDPGLLQVEFGAFYARQGGTQRGVGSPLTLRLGLTDWIEARLGADGVISQVDQISRQTGVGNTSIGAKLRLWADPGGAPVVSILPTIVFPTADAARGLGSGDRDYLLALLTGRDIGRRWHADVNYGIGRIGAGDGQPHVTQHLGSVSVSVAATDNWNPYAEVFWFSEQNPRGGSMTGVDAGATYELGARYAVDGGVEFGRSGVSHEVTVFAGISMVVGDILGNHGVHARQRPIRRRKSRS